MAAEWKYDLTGAEIILKDVLATNDTYAYGEVMSDSATEALPISGADGDGPFLGVSNEAVTISGTIAAGTSTRMKVIINPFAVYRCEYYLGTAGSTSNLITYGTVTDTTIPFTDSGSGLPSFGTGWMWSYGTGKLDWVVSSAHATATTMTTVTGTDTTSDYGVIIYPAPQDGIIGFETNGLYINGDVLARGTEGSSGHEVHNLMNWIHTSTYGWEMLVPAVMNQKTRYMAIETASGKTRDKGRVYSDLCFFVGSTWNV